MTELAVANPVLAAPLSPSHPDIAAQVAFSVRHEWCERLEDFMLRRSYLGFASDRGLSAAAAVSYCLQGELQWSEARRRHELDTYRARVERDQLPVRADEPADPLHGDTRETSSMVGERRRA